MLTEGRDLSIRTLRPHSRASHTVSNRYIRRFFPNGHTVHVYGPLEPIGLTDDQRHALDQGGEVKLDDGTSIVDLVAFNDRFRYLGDFADVVKYATGYTPEPAA